VSMRIKDAQHHNIIVFICEKHPSILIRVLKVKKIIIDWYLDHLATTTHTITWVEGRLRSRPFFTEAGKTCHIRATRQTWSRHVKSY
jgi:hypothetical protein